MNRHPVSKTSNGAGTGLQIEKETGLQAQFRSGELDRDIASSRFQLVTVRWIMSPVLLAALVFMIVGFVLGWGSFGPVLGGTVGILGAFVALFQRAARIEEELNYLIEKRDSG